MTETATRIDAQAELAKWTRQLGFMFTADLKHMPEASFTESIGGKTRNVGSIVSEMVTAPWGQPMSRYEFAQIVANHIWYHDGQLNLIQAFHGDEEVHWMG